MNAPPEGVCRPAPHQGPVEPHTAPPAEQRVDPEGPCEAGGSRAGDFLLGEWWCPAVPGRQLLVPVYPNLRRYVPPDWVWAALKGGVKAADRQRGLDHHLSFPRGQYQWLLQAALTAADGGRTPHDDLCQLADGSGAAGVRFAVHLAEASALQLPDDGAVGAAHAAVFAGVRSGHAGYGAKLVGPNGACVFRVAVRTCDLPLLSDAELRGRPGWSNRKPAYERRLDTDTLLTTSVPRLERSLDGLHDAIIRRVQRWLDQLAGHAAPDFDGNYRLVQTVQELAHRYGLSLILSHEGCEYDVGIRCHKSKGMHKGTFGIWVREGGAWLPASPVWPQLRAAPRRAVWPHLRPAFQAAANGPRRAAA